MTPSEFKAWFDGFTEAFGNKLPSKAQWARVKERVAEIDGKPITERVFVDRWYSYWHQHYPYYQGTLMGYATCNNTQLQNAQNAIQGANAVSYGQISSVFDSEAAMNAIGRAEAANLTG